MKLEYIEQYMKEAEQLIYANEVDRGIALLDSLLYDEPGYGSLHNHLGWAYMYYTGDAARAELHLRMAIRFHPEMQAPYIHLGNLMIRLGKYSEAIQALEVGVTKPDAYRPSYWESIGRACEMKADYKKAIHAYKQALISTLASHEMTAYTEGIKRCRKKRLVLMFTF